MSKTAPSPSLTPENPAAGQPDPAAKAAEQAAADQAAADKAAADKAAEQAAAEQEAEFVSVSVPQAFTLRRDDGTSQAFAAGAGKMTEEDLSHWFSQAMGVRAAAV